MHTYLITGSSGFIGKHLIDEILTSNPNAIIYCLVRSKFAQRDNVIQIQYSDLDELWSISIPWNKIDSLIHLASIAHKNESLVNDKELYKVNVKFTKILCNICVENDVKRFIYLSTAGVLGSTSMIDPLTNKSPKSPHSKYAYSKLLSESIIKHSLEQSQVKYIIIRPPLVIGPSAPGNFGKLLKTKSIPLLLPKFLTKNRRSLINVRNLANFINYVSSWCTEKNHTFLVGDSKQVSTAEILKQIKKGSSIPLILIPLPASLIRLLFTLTGNSKIFSQLTQSLEIDPTQARDETGWTPPYQLFDFSERSKN